MRIVPGSWKIPIGRTYHGHPVFLNLNGGSPHTKVAGVTGSGKSVAMKSMGFYICNQHSPKDVEIHIIDLKGGATFAQFELLPHVFKVYRDTAEALLALSYCKDQMWERLDQIRDARKRFEPDPKFKTIVVIIDEGGEMAPADAIGEEKKLRSACMEVLSSLARVGREAGIRLIYGTQRPDVHTLPMTVRPQLENTLCFRVAEHYDSKIVLGHEGAEELPQIPGRMIFKTPNGEKRVQGVYIPDDVLTNWIKQYAGYMDIESGLMDEVSQDDADKVSKAGVSTDTSSVIDITRFLR